VKQNIKVQKIENLFGFDLSFVLQYFIVSYAEILRYCKKNLGGGMRLFHIVLRLSGTKNISKLGKNLF
jgi:hypothetical protein